MREKPPQTLRTNYIIARCDEGGIRIKPKEAGCNARIRGNDLLRHVWQAKPFADDAKHDVVLEDLLQGLGAGLHLGIAGRPA